MIADAKLWPRRAGRWLRRHAFAIGIAFVYLYAFPYFPSIHSANELPRAYLTKAIVDDGTVAIDGGVAQWGDTGDTSPHGGHVYSNKAPGSSLLAVPAYLALEGATAVLYDRAPTLGEMVWTFRVATGVIPSLLFLWLLWVFLARFTPNPATRRLAIVAYALGSMAMTYSVLFIAHQLSAVCIGAAYVFAVWAIEDGRSDRWLAGVGFAAGCALLVDYQAAFAGLPLAVYLAVRLVRRDRDGRRRLRGFLIAAAAAVPPVAALLAYHVAAFGGPFTTGYAVSKVYGFHHQHGFLGLDTFRWQAFVGSTIAPDNGLLVFCPVLAVALLGWWWLWRGARPTARMQPTGRGGGAGLAPMGRREAGWHLMITFWVVLVFLLFISSINFWRGGWQMGPRYITAMLPFAMVPVTIGLAVMATRWWSRGIAVGLVGVGVVVYAGSCAVFPHFPDRFPNPLYEVTFRLLGDGHVAWNAGWWLGLRGVASLVPYFAVVGGLFLWVALPTRAAWRSALLGVALTVAVIVAYAAFPRGGKDDDRAYRDHVAGAMPR